MGDGEDLDGIRHHAIGDHRSAAIGGGAHACCQIVTGRAAFGEGGEFGGMRLYLAGIVKGRFRIGLTGDPFIER